MVQVLYSRAHVGLSLPVDGVTRLFKPVGSWIGQKVKPRIRHTNGSYADAKRMLDEATQGWQTQQVAKGVIESVAPGGAGKMRIRTRSSTSPTPSTTIDIEVPSVGGKVEIKFYD